MIKVVIAYDDNDSALGDYFEESYDNLCHAIHATGDNQTIVLRGLDCDEANINSAVVPLNINPFVFVGLSHGDITGTYLLTESDNYVSPDNAVNFPNSFFYTTGCNVGLVLREALLENNCKVFVGYTDYSKAPLNEDYNSMFIDCELFALKQFMSTNNTLHQLFSEMLDYTQTQIDYLFAHDEIVEAMDLQSNKDCISIFGDGSLRKSDFQVI